MAIASGRLISTVTEGALPNSRAVAMVPKKQRQTVQGGRAAIISDEIEAGIASVRQAHQQRDGILRVSPTRTFRVLSDKGLSYL